jgi:hypothetical protein
MLEVVHFRDEASLHSRTWPGVRARGKSLIDRDRAATAKLYLRPCSTFTYDPRSAVPEEKIIDKRSFGGPIINFIATLATYCRPLPWYCGHRATG